MNQDAEISWEMTPRAKSIGGGWRLSLLEDGVEVGGGVFPAVACEFPFDEAMQVVDEWLSAVRGDHETA